MSIRIGIMGYGNLGRGIEAAITRNDDLELAAVFTRRDPATVKTATDVKVVPAAEAPEWSDKIDVLVICGGSATDLPKQTPEYVKYFNVVDSFDTHANVPQHFENVDRAAKEAGHLALISCGWDPGLFSLARIYGDAILPDSKVYTFWGTDRAPDAHQRVLRRRRGRCGQGGDRRDDQDHAQLLCGL